MFCLTLCSSFTKPQVRVMSLFTDITDYQTHNFYNGQYLKLKRRPSDVFTTFFGKLTWNCLSPVFWGNEYLSLYTIQHPLTNRLKAWRIIEVTQYPVFIWSPDFFMIESIEHRHGAMLVRMLKLVWIEITGLVFIGWKC